MIIATGRYLGEGFDDARLDTLFLALPIVAVLKIIFDRTESFKQWGALLGDERPAKSPMNFPIFRKKKPIPVGTQSLKR